LCWAAFAALPDPAAAAAAQGRIISAEFRPAVIQAGAVFNIRLSVQNTGPEAWQTYGLRVRLYSSKRRLIKFPAGVDFAYSVTAAWAAGLAASIDTPVTAPGLNEFFSTGLASGDYYYLPELYASPTACTQAELFRKAPVAKGTLRELRINNPSVYKRNAAVTAVKLSTAAASVTLRNFSNANFSNLVLRAYADGAPLGERAVELLPAQQQAVLEFPGEFQEGKKVLLRAVLAVDDDNQEDNYLSAEAAP
jgi:hypothetical protein